jgi:hypothetical protein
MVVSADHANGIFGEKGFPQLMSTLALRTCRRARCAKPIPPALISEQLCLVHFLDEASVRANDTLDRCREGRTLDRTDVEWLLTDALAIVKNLEEPEAASSDQRERMLDMLLILANLHEYVARGSTHPHQVS